MARIARVIVTNGAPFGWNKAFAAQQHTCLLNLLSLWQ
jgi:hypothetical protein